MKTYLGRSVLALALVAAASSPAFAGAKGDVTLGVGAHTVDPKSDNGALAGDTLPLDIGSSTRPTITGEYFVRDGLGIEVLAALPFQHDIRIDGVGKVGSTKHLPPTVSLQYHFNNGGAVSPLVGIGLNYTMFFKERTTGALAGTELSLDDSWGAALHAGVDFKVGERGAIRVDARWIDIDTTVKVDGTDLGKAHIDPLAYGVAYIVTF